MAISELNTNKPYLNFYFLNKNKIVTLVICLASLLFFSLTILTIYFGVQLGLTPITILGSISLFILLVLSFTCLLSTLKNKFTKTNSIFLEKKEHATQTNTNLLSIKQSSKKTSIQLYNDKQPKTTKNKNSISLYIKSNKQNLIEDKIKTLIAKNWRLVSDKEELPRYLCINCPIGLFLSVRQGSLFYPLSSSANRCFSAVIDMNDIVTTDKKNVLQSLIPSEYSLIFDKEIPNILINIACSNQNYPLLSELICIKESFTFSPEEEKTIPLSTSFNFLKTSYIKILNIAINLRIQVLQLTPLKIPFLKTSTKIKEDLSKLALLEAIHEVTKENRSMGALQEIILISNRMPYY